MRFLRLFQNHTLVQLLAITAVIFGGTWTYFHFTSDASVSNSQINLSDGLVGHWSMDDGTGTHVSDLSGNGNDGTMTNMDPNTDWVTGKLGKALDFDGVNDYETLSSRPIGSNSSSFSVSLWMNARTVNTGGGSYLNQKQIFNLSDSPTMYISQTGYLEFVFWNGSSYQGVVGSEMISTNQWYHVVGTYDGSGLRLFVDGKKSAINNIGYFLTSPRTPIENVTGKANTNDRYFNGQIDDVRVYNRALSGEEVKALFTQTQQTIQQKDTKKGLVGYWSMDDGTGTHVSDLSGNNNNGTMTNMDANTDWVDGRLGKALDFDGSNDYVTSATFGDSQAWGALSTSFWFKTSVSTSMHVMVTRGTSGDSWAAYMDSSGRVGFIFDVVSDVALLSSNGYDDGQWHYFSSVWDGTDLTVSIDKESLGPVTFSSPLPGQSASYNLSLGSHASNSTFFFNGQLDEVRIYNRALSQDEITSLYQETRAQFTSSQATKDNEGLVGYWSFNGADVNDTTVFDRSGNGNDGIKTSSSSTDNLPQPTKGQVGQALDFDGADDAVELSNQSFANDHTVTAWIYKRDTSTSTILSRANACSTSARENVPFGFYTESLKLRFRIAFTANCNAGFATDIYETVDDVLSLNTWHHVVISIEDNDSDERVLRMYVDGVEVAWDYVLKNSDVISSPIFPGENAGQKTAIGATWAGDTSTYIENINGRLDDVRVYNHVLSDQEILEMYQRESGKDRTEIGLVGYWPMRDGSGTEVRDYSDNGNHGTMTNMDAGTDWVQGKVGQALDFDGSDDYVNVGDVELTNVSISISVWVNSNTLVNRPIVSKYRATGDQRSYALIISSGSVLSFGVSEDGTTNANSWVSVQSTTTPLTNQWYHVVGTFNNSTGSAKMYVNGGREAETINTNVTSIYNTTRSLRIGNFESAGEKYTDGQIDEVRIYNRALLDEDVKLLYQRGR